MTTHATLCFIIKRGKILLMKKKKGLGAGVWNGPGGKIESGESAQDCAKRETYEEVNVVPEAPQKVGELRFFFGQRLDADWHVHVFMADDFDGIERETDEGAPKWFRIEQIPYGEMWPDDKLWMPLLLQGKKFLGDFYYDKDAKQLYSHDLKEVAFLN